MAEIFVGSVSVGVVPDAKTFNDDIRKQIFPDADNVGREYGAKLGRGIQESVRIYIDKIKAELKDGLPVDVKADTTQAKDDIDAMRTEQEARPVKVKVETDQTSLRNFANSLGSQVKRAIGNLALGSLIGTGLAGGASALIAGAGPLGAATLGLGAAAAIILPEVTKVTTALGKVGAARKTAFGQLTPQERDMAKGLEGIKDDFESIQKALAPAVDELVKLGSGFVKSLLPELEAFAGTGLSIIRNFLIPLSAWVKTRAFGELSDQFAQFADKAGQILGPQLVKLLQAFSQLFVKLLPTGIIVLQELLPSITQIVIALTPGIVILAKITANVLKWVLAHHLLIPVLIATLAIVVVIAGPTGLGGIIAATLLVALVVGAFATHWKQWWQDIKNWAQDAWNFLTHGWGQLLIPGLTAIRIIIEVVRDHWRAAWTDIKDWARAVWNFLINGIGQLLVPQIKQIWIMIVNVRDHWQSAWSDIKSIGLAAWHFLYNNIFSVWINLFNNTLPNAFRTVVSVLGRVWGTLKDIFSGPVRFLIDTVYDNGIARLWNDVMNKVGGPVLPIVPKLASGGRIPGYGGGDVHPALLEAGETVVSKEHSRFLAPIFKAAGVPGYSGGGLIGGIGHFFGSLFGGIGDAAKLATALLTGNSTAAANALGGLIHTPAHADLATMMIDIPKTIITNVVKWGLSHIASVLSVGGGGPHGAIGGGVQRYAGLVLQVLSLLRQPSSDLGVVLAQMTTESGGNPYAVNKTDSNWLAGHPSVGLMQVIAGTFDTYAGPFRNIGPFQYGVSEDPLANIFAGINYAIHRYPGYWTEVLGHGHGYDQGGYWPSGTFGWNTSGHTEYVLTHDDMNHMGGTQYHAHFDGVTYQAHRGMVRQEFKEMEIGKGRLARMGWRQ